VSGGALRRVRGPATALVVVAGLAACAADGAARASDGLGDASARTAGLSGPVGLIGLQRELLLAQLGEPGFLRRDGPAQLWRYTADTCLLDVFLYRRGDGFAVSHVESRPRFVAPGVSPAPVSPDSCYARLRSMRGAAAAS